MRAVVSVAGLLGCVSIASAADWQASLTKDPPGKFAALRPVRAKYNFGWSGFTAALGEVHFSRMPATGYVLEGNGHTIGLVRALWRYDVDYRAVADAGNLRPIETKQTETTRGKKTITTNLTFTGSGVSRSRTENKSAPTVNKPKQLRLANLYDLHSAMLYLRSQPLKDRSVYRVAVYPTTNAYLATLTVTGRERILVRAGAYNAIKLDLHLDKIGKNLALEPHRKFKRATVWISDDADRLVLRIEAQIFVGTVFAELQSAQFDTAKR